MEYFTYLMKSKGLFKIGQSQDPKLRLSQLKTGNPDITLITYGKGATESMMHKLYDKKRIIGEWFKLTDKEVVDCVNLIKDGSKVYREIVEPVKSKNYEFKINFGKFANRIISTMTNEDEIKYVKWYVKNATNKKCKNYKVFKWWLTELGY
jgi:hypothetical protein